MNRRFKHTAIATFLAFILFFYNINNIVIVIDFLINQDEIAKTLCVQKDDQKGCNGKCQLMKELKIENNAPNTIPTENNKTNWVEITFIKPINEINVNHFNPTKNNHTVLFKVVKPILKYYEIDTPPPVYS